MLIIFELFLYIIFILLSPFAASPFAGVASREKGVTFEVLKSRLLLLLVPAGEVLVRCFGCLLQNVKGTFIGMSRVA